MLGWNLGALIYFIEQRWESKNRKLEDELRDARRDADLRNLDESFEERRKLTRLLSEEQELELSLSKTELEISKEAWKRENMFGLFQEKKQLRRQLEILSGNCYR
ncbi:hypothetical protein SPFM10_00153 [Salmonella phage SPFM10]|nr:hypothetical protein SPFM10_00153 [Salmonella phage SPFM10]